jgi:hypothetical protein
LESNLSTIISQSNQISIVYTRLKPEQSQDFDLNQITVNLINQPACSFFEISEQELASSLTSESFNKQIFTPLYVRDSFISEQPTMSLMEII